MYNAIMLILPIYLLVGGLWVGTTYVYWKDPTKYNLKLTMAVNVLFWPICMVWSLCTDKIK